MSRVPYQVVLAFAALLSLAAVGTYLSYAVLSAPSSGQWFNEIDSAPKHRRHSTGANDTGDVELPTPPPTRKPRPPRKTGALPAGRPMHLPDTHGLLPISVAFGMNEANCTQSCVNEPQCIAVAVGSREGLCTMYSKYSLGRGNDDADHGSRLFIVRGNSQPLNLLYMMICAPDRVQEYVGLAVETWAAHNDIMIFVEDDQVARVAAASVKQHSGKDRKHLLEFVFVSRTPVYPHDGYGARNKNFQMMQHLVASNVPLKYSWYAVVDSDTFIIAHNLHLLLRESESTFQHPYYLGHSDGTLFPYGGAGIFINAEAMEAIRPHIDFCAKRHLENSGDRRLGYCLEQFGAQMYPHPALGFLSIQDSRPEHVRAAYPVTFHYMNAPTSRSLSMCFADNLKARAANEMHYPITWQQLQKCHPGLAMFGFRR